MGSRREYLVLVVVVVLTIVLGLIAASDSGPTLTDTRASSFHSTPHGTRALYLLLQEFGLTVERRVTPLTTAPTAPLVLLAPSVPLTPGESSTLSQWIEEGGVLIYAARPGDPMLEMLGLGELVGGGGGVEVDSAGADSVTAELAEADSATAGSAATDSASADSAQAGAEHPDTTFMPAYRWAFADTAPALRAPGAVVLERNSSGEAVVVAWPEGEGRVVAWSDVALLRNRTLRQSGALAVTFVQEAVTAASAADGRISFDEFHHGYRGDGNVFAGTYRYLTGTRPGHMTLQLGLVAAGLLLLAGWRFGAPLPAETASRRSPLEHLDALAGLYDQAGARRTARSLLLAQLARRLGRTPPRDPAEEDQLLAELEASARLRGGGDLVVARLERVRATWRGGERGEGDVDLVKLARELDNLIAEVRGT